MRYRMPDYVKEYYSLPAISKSDLMYIITETYEKDTLYLRLSVAWMLQSSLHGGIYGVS